MFISAVTLALSLPIRFGVKLSALTHNAFGLIKMTVLLGFLVSNGEMRDPARDLPWRCSSAWPSWWPSTAAFCSQHRGEKRSKNLLF